MQLIQLMADLRPLVTFWVFLVFIGLMAWIFWPRRRQIYDNAASIPLRDDR